MLNIFAVNLSTRYFENGTNIRTRNLSRDLVFHNAVRLQIVGYFCTTIVPSLSDSVYVEKSLQYYIFLLF